jgi:hypothetical protein
MKVFQQNDYFEEIDEQQYLKYCSESLEIDKKTSQKIESKIKEIISKKNNVTNFDYSDKSHLFVFDFDIKMTGRQPLPENEDYLGFEHIIVIRELQR